MWIAPGDDASGNLRVDSTVLLPPGVYATKPNGLIDSVVTANNVAWQKTSLSPTNGTDKQARDQLDFLEITGVEIGHSGGNGAADNFEVIGSGPSGLLVGALAISVGGGLPANFGRRAYGVPGTADDQSTFIPGDERYVDVLLESVDTEWWAWVVAARAFAAGPDGVHGRWAIHMFNFDGANDIDDQPTTLRIRFMKDEER